MLEIIQIEDNEDFEFDLTELGLIEFSLNFEQNEETNEFEIYISGNNQIFPLIDLIENSLVSEENEILFINSEQKEVINDLLKSLLKNNTNKIDSYESK